MRDTAARKKIAKRAGVVRQKDLSSGSPSRSTSTELPCTIAIFPQSSAAAIRLLVSRMDRAMLGLIDADETCSSPSNLELLSRSTKLGSAPVAGAGAWVPARGFSARPSRRRGSGKRK